jgi:hypothetical protein
MKLRLTLFVAALALVAVACGADDAPTVVEPAATEPAVAETAPAAADGTVSEDSVSENAAVAAGPGDVPDLAMTDVYTGQAVNLQTLVTGQTPVLLWFWAPH